MTVDVAVPPVRLTTYAGLPAGVTWMSKPVSALLPMSADGVQLRCTALRAPRAEKAVGAAGTVMTCSGGKGPAGTTAVSVETPLAEFV